MKKEQGITLVSLIVYVILMTFIIALISSITASFYANINDFDNNSESAVAYSKFNMHFINDIKKDEATIEESYEDHIILSYTTNSIQEGNEGVTVTGKEKVTIEYLIQDDVLYRNKVKICEDVKKFLITTDKANNIIKINMAIGDYEKVVTYVVEDMSGTNGSSNSDII